jgi:hypothetical protein
MGAPHLNPRSWHPARARRTRLADPEKPRATDMPAERALRGPVLRGFALVLEIEPRKAGRGTLALKEVGPEGRVFRKHFVPLRGMGVRDLLWVGDDLLILAGPTMDVDGPQVLYRLREAAGLEADSIIFPKDPRLEPLFDLPTARAGDRAEGMARYDGLGEPGVLVVYDAPLPERRLVPDGVYADVFALPLP